MIKGGKMLNIKWFPDWNIIKKTEDYTIYKKVNSGFEQKIYECKSKVKTVGVLEPSQHENRKLSMTLSMNGCLSPDKKHFIIPLGHLSDVDYCYDL
jgi:hypothetical protein